MKYKAHIVGGLLAGAAVMHFTKSNLYTPEGAVFLLAAGAGALLPDIDHESSFLGSRIKPLSKVISKSLGHRGATHSPILIALIFMCIHLLVGEGGHITMGLMTGALSHVFLDALTISGVPILYPYRKEKYSLMNFRTGGLGEKILSIAMIGTFVWIVFPK